MVYKPLNVKKFLEYLKIAGWSLKKGSIDYKLYDQNGNFVCAIKIGHGKKTKHEVIAHSVHKTKLIFEERGIEWPPKKK